MKTNTKSNGPNGPDPAAKALVAAAVRELLPTGTTFLPREGLDRAGAIIGIEGWSRQAGKTKLGKLHCRIYSLGPLKDEHPALIEAQREAAEELTGDANAGVRTAAKAYLERLQVPALDPEALAGHRFQAVQVRGDRRGVYEGVSDANGEFSFNGVFLDKPCSLELVGDVAETIPFPRTDPASEPAVRIVDLAADSAPEEPSFPDNVIDAHFTVRRCRTRAEFEQAVPLKKAAGFSSAPSETTDQKRISFGEEDWKVHVTMLPTADGNTWVELLSGNKILNRARIRVTMGSKVETVELEPGEGYVGFTTVGIAFREACEMEPRFEVFLLEPAVAAADNIIEVEFKNFRRMEELVDYAPLDQGASPGWLRPNSVRAPTGRGSASAGC